jgi:RHS repeat-associated protein
MRTIKWVFILCQIIFFFFTIELLAQTGDDGWNNRILNSYQSDVEVARVSIRLAPGYQTTGHTYLHAYIDPDLPYKGGTPATDGEFNMNYIRIYTPKADNTITSVPQYSQVDFSKWFITTTYYDGIGRPIQVVDVKGIPNGCDKITPIKYDLLGRQKEDYLPYSLMQGGGNGPGGYRENDMQENEDFNDYYFPGEGVFAKSIKDFDNSPLNRVIKSLGPGLAWQGNGSQKPIETIYYVNSESEIFLLTVSTNNELVKNGYYPKGGLFKAITKDENGNQKIEYKDFKNHVVASCSIDESELVITQYVYDEFNHLRFIILPKAADNIPSGSGSNSFSCDTEWIKDLCWYYQYDSKERIILKRVPGCSRILYVYNGRNMMVLSQDGNQFQNNQWMFFKYDVFNRKVLSGVYNHGNQISQVDMQNLVDGNENYFEEFSSSNPVHGYTSNCFPTNSSMYEVYNVIYYDNYLFLNHTSNVGDYSFKSGIFDFNYTVSNKTNGMITGEKAKVLEHDNLTASDNWLLTVHYYDKYCQEIQKIADNHLGGKEITSNKINFTGKLIKSQTIDNYSLTPYKLTQTFDYNNVDLITTDKIKFCEDPEIFLNKNIYNDLAQVKRKCIHSSNGSDFLQSTTYSFNIRGWLSEINNINGLGNNCFAMKLDYTFGDHPQFNGNISSLSWTSKQFPELMQYQFNYDGLDRITNGSYNNAQRYDVSYKYDKNGNITYLTRNGEISLNSFGPIDDLTYKYLGNKLLSVDDKPDPQYQNNGFKDNGSFINNEYLYDEDGNMVKDYNKQIENVSYNYLNLPQKVEVASGNQQLILYLYDANGKKLCKQTRVDQAINNSTDYIGSFVYENQNLLYILTPEGRIVRNNETNEYQYFLKDHLGNNRVLVNSNGTILQDYSYYPFGMVMDGLNFTAPTSIPNKYMFNGKEIQNDFDLNWYDYGARFYDPQLGRWHSVDQMAEERPWESPYSFCGGNPLNRIDPDGRIWDKTMWDDRHMNSIMRWANGFTQEHFNTFQSMALAKNSVSTLFKSNNFFRDAWNDAQKSSKTFTISEARGGSHTPENGNYNPINNMITLISGKFSSSTLFEEVIHVGQDLFYDNKSNAPGLEVEAHLLKALTGQEGSIITTLSNKNVISYLNAMAKGEKVSGDIIKNAQGELQADVQSLINERYNFSSTELDQFNANPLPALDYTIDTMKKDNIQFDIPINN